MWLETGGWAGVEGTEARRPQGLTMWDAEGRGTLSWGDRHPGGLGAGEGQGQHQVRKEPPGPAGQGPQRGTGGWVRVQVEEDEARRGDADGEQGRQRGGGVGRRNEA